MAEYLTLFFESDYGNTPILKKWMVQRGQALRAKEPLFLYGEGAQQKTFFSEIKGTFKIFLLKEGDPLHPGCEIAVISASPKDAKSIQKKGFGKIIQPEEFKVRAESGSIRLPPEEE